MDFEHRPSHFPNCFMGTQEGERGKLGFGGPVHSRLTTRIVN